MAARHARTCDTVSELADRYRQRVRARPELWDALAELEGAELGCWCRPRPCHGDLLIELFKERFGDARVPPTVCSVAFAKLRLRGYKDAADWATRSARHVYIGRRVQRGKVDVPASKWANPFTLSRKGRVDYSRLPSIAA